MFEVSWYDDEATWSLLVQAFDWPKCLGISVSWRCLIGDKASDHRTGLELFHHFKQHTKDLNRSEN